MRPIGPADDARHGAFFAQLAPEDLRLRFFSSRREIPHAEIERRVHPDAATEVAFVVLAQRADGSPEELATARAVAGADNVEAEFGITVRSDLKGQGLGRLLLARLIERVKRRGTQRIACEVLRENRPMRALARRLGFRIEQRSPRTGTAALRARPAARRGAPGASMSTPAAAAPWHALAFNSGSSSLKFGLYEVRGGRAACLVGGEARRIGEGRAEFRAVDPSGGVVCLDDAPLRTPQDVVARVARCLTDTGAPAPQAVGHRVVHGGPALRRHCRIDDAVLRQLEAARAYAPLHTPAVLSVIRGAQARFPGLPEVACFDTAFHARMPAVASVLPLPAALRAQGIRRYGFHGLSCESVVQQLAQAAGGRLPHRLLIAHLGNGASVTAVRDGVSIDTSMGLTPSGGLIMGTRSGDLDPGVLVYLAREQGYDAAMLEDLVDHRSGLAGVSGLDGDMRTLHAAAASNADAALAIRMFCYAVRKQLAAMWAVLDGVDAIVFTGGIGEHDAAVRSGDLHRADVAGRAARRGAPSCAGRSDQQRRLELPGARAAFAGRRADRPAHGGAGRPGLNGRTRSVGARATDSAPWRPGAAPLPAHRAPARRAARSGRRRAAAIARPRRPASDAAARPVRGETRAASAAAWSGACTWGVWQARGE